jgi:arylsulfatase A-like enzyme
MGSAVSKDVKVIEQNIQNIDIAPTILDIAGLQKPAHFEGLSFKDLLEGEMMPWRDTIYYYEYFFHWIKDTDGDQMYLRSDGSGAGFDEGKVITYKKTY